MLNTQKACGRVLRLAREAEALESAPHSHHLLARVAHDAAATSEQ